MSLLVTCWFHSVSQASKTHMGGETFVTPKTPTKVSPPLWVSHSCIQYTTVRNSRPKLTWVVWLRLDLRSKANFTFIPKAQQYRYVRRVSEKSSGSPVYSFYCSTGIQCDTAVAAEEGVFPPEAVVVQHVQHSTLQGCSMIYRYIVCKVCKANVMTTQTTVRTYIHVV